MGEQDRYNEGYEAGRSAMYQEFQDYAVKLKKEESKSIIVTVIWNDRFCDGLSEYRAEGVKFTERSDGNIYVEGLVRQAMRQYGYDEAMIKEAIQDYGLAGIIKGRVEWLA